jgi:cytidylate kinase
MTRSIQQIVEEQVGRWRLDQEARRRAPQRPSARPDVITISRSFGSEGSAIAARVGDILGLPVYDRQVVEHIAQSAAVHVQTVDTLDEQAVGRIDDYLAALLRERNFDQGDYLKLLIRTVVALWEHGPCVFLGHGAVHVVDRRHALAVRIVLPDHDRAERLAASQHIELADARRRVHRADAEREAFHRRFFGAVVNDAQLYDMTLNSLGIGVDDCAALVAEAYRRKFAAAEETQV